MEDGSYLSQLSDKLEDKRRDGLLELYDFYELYPIEGYPSLREKLLPEPQEHQRALVDYLKHGGRQSAVGDKRLEDFMTGKLLSPCILVYKDEAYVWDNQVIHYVENYNMELPEDFVAHVLKKQRRN